MIELEQNYAERLEMMEYLRTISDDLNKTLEDLSQIVNIENETDIIVEALNLNFYLNRVLNIVSAYGYKKNATVINNIPKDSTVNFNPAYLESVLRNLCTNAIKFADPKESLIIEFNFFLEDDKKY